MNSKILQEIKSKREFSQLRDIDIERNFELFSKRQATEQEKIDLTKEQLRKLFTAFLSKKLLSPKEKSSEWILRKHLSTNERLPYYPELYKRVFDKNNKEVSIFDLGCGINGFSYNYFPSKIKVNYSGFESVGQLVEITNSFFQKNNLFGKCYHLSLFEIEEIKKIIKKAKGNKILFLFKVIDALESVELNYSKKLISDLSPLVYKVVLSFSTRSLGGKNNFKANRKWILDFIQENFKVLQDFELGNERYLVFEKRIKV